MNKNRLSFHARKGATMSEISSGLIANRSLGVSFDDSPSQFFSPDVESPPPSTKATTVHPRVGDTASVGSETSNLSAAAYIDAMRVPHSELQVINKCFVCASRGPENGEEADFFSSTSSSSLHSPLHYFEMNPSPATLCSVSARSGSNRPVIPSTSSIRKREDEQDNDFQGQQIASSQELLNIFLRLFFPLSFCISPHQKVQSATRS
jgi:hypothetical protein